MNKIILGAVALTFAASAAAYAQTTPPPPPPGGAAAPAHSGMTPPPPPPPGAGPMGPDGMAGPDAMGGPGGKRHGEWRHMHHRAMMNSKAAHFRVRSGDMVVDVKCADDDTTKACGDVVMQIVNRLSAAQDNDGDYDNDDNSNSNSNDDSGSNSGGSE